MGLPCDARRTSIWSTVYHLLLNPLDLQHCRTQDMLKMVPNIFTIVIRSLMWKQQNLAAAALTPILGLICSLIAWLVTAKKEGGNLSVDSTGAK